MYICLRLRLLGENRRLLHGVYSVTDYPKPTRMDKEKIKSLFDANRLDAATALLQASPDDAWAQYMLGRIAWKQGRRADAIECYERAAASDVASEAAVALEQAREVMDFFNKDLYNP